MDALMFGDSLLYESAASVRANLASLEFDIVARPGAAMCDLLPPLRSRLERQRPKVVVLESIANGITPCMAKAGTLGSERFARRYINDTRVAIALVRHAHARVVFVVPPPLGALSTGMNPALSRLEARLRNEFGNRSGVSFIDGPRDAVSASGRFTATLPCDPTETSRSACRGGQITVRDPVFGVHFCPRPYRTDAALRAGCPVYSSGAVRFGGALAASVLAEMNDQAG